jgi:hypothetical protein
MKRFAVSICLVALVAGCGASSTVDSSLEEEEDIGTAEQALGEFACATTNIAASPSLGAVIASPSWFCAYSNTATSPDGSYGSSTGECSSQFVTEVQQVSGHSFSPVVRPYGMNAMDQTTCEKLHATLGAYGHKASGWSSLGTASAHGVWRSYPGGWQWCDLELDAGSGSTAVVTGAEGYDVIRAAGAAYTIESYKGTTYPSYRQVTVGLEGGGPC